MNRWNTVSGPTKLRIEFPHETGLILSCAGKVGPPCRQSRGIDPPVAIRRGEEAQLKRCWACGAREVRFLRAWLGGVRHCSRVMVGESHLKTR